MRLLRKKSKVEMLFFIPEGTVEVKPCKLDMDNHIHWLGKKSIVPEDVKVYSTSGDQEGIIYSALFSALTLVMN